MIVWFTGRPASGKSTLARRVRELVDRPSVLLDSDEIRAAIGATGYGEHDRDGFYRALGELALVVERQGVIALVAATAARRAYRDAVRARAGRFLEVHVRASQVECEARDIKGLYARARAGTAPDLPGVGADYEEPLAAEIVARGGVDEAAVQAVVHAIQSTTEPMYAKVSRNECSESG